jgi:hypothetical protein
LQVRPNTPYAHIISNILVDQGRIEANVLCLSEDDGLAVLRDGRLLRNVNLIWCNGSQDAGPTEMSRKGQSELMFPWKQAPPQALLSQVRAAPRMLPFMVSVLWNSS